PAQPVAADERIVRIEQRDVAAGRPEEAHEARRDGFAVIDEAEVIFSAPDSPTHVGLGETGDANTAGAPYQHLNRSLDAKNAKRVDDVDAVTAALQRRLAMAARPSLGADEENIHEKSR